MADAVVSFALDNVISILLEGSKISKMLESSANQLDDLVQSAGLEVGELRDILEFPGEYELFYDQNWTKRAKSLADEAEHLYETIKKKIDKFPIYHSKMLRPLRVIKYRRMSNELGRVSGEIGKILIIARRYFEVFSNSSSKITMGEEPNSFAVKNRSPKFVALEQLEFVLLKAKYSVHDKVYKDIMSVEGQLLPMLDLLDDMKSTQKIDNRQRVWMEILEESFKSIGNSFKDFVELVAVRIPTDDVFDPMEKEKEMEGIILQQARRLCGMILLKKNEICKIWNRYHIFRIGAFEGLDGLRLVVDPNLSVHVGDKMDFDWTFVDYFQIDQEVQIDLKLMKALTKDAEPMGNLDEREKVWAKQIEEIQKEMEIVDQWYQQFRTAKLCKLGKKYINLKFSIRAQRLEEMIEHISMRARFYCIGSPELRYGSGSSDECRLFRDSWTIEDKVASVKRELQLMEALFKDVKTLGQLDDCRLNVWLEEMHCVALEAKEIIQQISKGSLGSCVASSKIHWIGTRISDISGWSLTYGIEGVGARKGSSSLTPELKEISHYPKDTVEEQVDHIKREVRMLKALDKDIKKMDRFNGGSLQAWVQELREISEEAEILISSYFNKKQHIPKNRIIKRMYELSQREEIHISDLFHTRNQVVRNVVRMKDKIQKLHQRRRAYGIQHFDRKCSNNADELRARLLADDYDHFRIIPILNAWEKDKVFLKEFIDEDDSIASRFSLCIWLPINQEENTVALQNIFKKVLQQQNSSTKIASEEINQYAGEEMINNRCLVVVDEVQNSFIWNSLQKLVKITKGSRIIFTTCHAEAHWSGLYTTTNDGLEIDTNQLSAGVDYLVFPPIQMRLLPQQKNMSRLGLLFGGRDELPKMPNPSAESIPSYLRECLYYFLLFPTKDSNGSDIYISIRRLIGIWVAEGIIHPKKDAKNVPIELIAEGYLSELIKLGMIEVKVKNGKIKRCRLKNDQQQREACFIKAKEYDFFQSKNSHPGQDEYFGVTMGNIYRLTDLPIGNSNACYSHIHSLDNHSVSLSSYYRNVRSFLSFNIQERSKPGEDIGNFLERAISKRCFLTLRVLDLEHIFRPALPKGLSKLIRLRYLGLRWTYLEALPPFVSDLLNLQVLDVKHTYISKLPKSIWRMQHLRHLYLSETYRSRFDGRPQSSKSLNNLQTLWGAFVDEDSPVEGGLDTLRNVRKLELLCRSMYDRKKMASQLEAVANWVVSLKDLESLRLKSHDEKCMPSDLYLKPLAAHVNLSMLHVVGILKYPSVISDLPLNLTEVTLSGCELEYDPLHSMEYLPRLVSLRLFANASKSKLMKCSSRGFAKLEILKIWKMEYLEELEVEEEGMPWVEDFEIRSCVISEKLPQRLQDICKRT